MNDTDFRQEDARQPDQGAQQEGPMKRVMEEARGAYEQVKQETVSEARKTTDHLRRTAEDSIESGKSQLASQVGSVAKAIHRGGDSLREDGHEALASQTDRLASRVEEVRTFLDDYGVEGAFDEVKHLARQRPWLLVGGALVAGAAVAAVMSGRSGDARGRREGYDGSGRR